MGAAVSAGAADDDSLVESLRCHACGCYWRQHADATDRQCPSWYLPIYLLRCGSGAMFACLC
eukprot:2520064-Rhodomonas_salina.3